MPFGLRRLFAWRERDLDGEDRTLAGLRTHAHPVSQQISQPPHDGKPKAQAAAAFARGVVELMIFLEDRLKFVFGNADAGIPDFDAQHFLVPAATQQHLALLGVFQGVGQQVADHLFEQARVAVYRQAARHDAQGQSLRLGVIGEFIAQPVEQIVDREAHGFRMHGAGLDLVYVEQRVQHARHGVQRLVEPRDQLLRLLALDGFGQQPLKQRQRLQRLAQIVACGGEEARFGDIGESAPAAWRPPACPPHACVR